MDVQGVGEAPAPSGLQLDANQGPLTAGWEQRGGSGASKGKGVAAVSRRETTHECPDLPFTSSRA